MKTITILIGLLLLASVAFAGPSTKCVWDESPEENVAGYYLYYGTASGVYTDAVKIEGKQNVCFMLADIPFIVGTQYFMAVTAYTTDGLESPYSNEIEYPVANAPAMTLQPEDSDIIITIKIPNCK